MDPVWLNIVTFLMVYTLAIVSPGPNFVLVLNTALNESRRSGLFTAFGVATGSGLFGLAGLLGLILIINSLPYFADLIRLVGGGYLVWLGVGMIRNYRRSLPSGPNLTLEAGKPTGLLAYRAGLLTNLSNPKAWVFYLSLFTLVIGPGLQLGHKIFLNLAMFLVSLGWYALVALLISSDRARPLFLRFKTPLQLVLGVLLVTLGGRILLG